MIWFLVLACILLVGLSHEESIQQTSVSDLTCVVYNVTAMNCTWSNGINPLEEYFLFLNFNQKEEQCQHRTKNNGKHVCHIAYVSADEEIVKVTLKKLVNQSQIIVDRKKFFLYEIEILRPPQNITVSCNALECTVKWTHPPNRNNYTGQKCFAYDIKDETGIIVNKTEDTWKVFPADRKHTLQIKARGQYCQITKKGEWSEPIEFGSDPYTFPTIYLTLVVLGTVLTILVLFCFCKRFSIWQKLTDPIPQPNFTFEPDENMGRAWLDLTQTDEKITFVEEITNSCNKNHEGLSLTNQLS